MTHKNKKHVFHLRRTGLFGLLLIAFFIVRSDAGASPQPLRSAHVLAYATEMSRESLHSGTNQARAANGLAGLNLDSQLNSSAQSKAQHMATNDYWAHVAPDGTEPWYFFNQAGYSYVRAGENLAYGFMTSQAAIDGWMNSPSHRANMLGNYNDVGFGIINTPNYQGKAEQTIVVAHYGARTAAPTPPAPAAPTTPAPTPSAPSTPQPPSPAPSPASVTPEPTSQQDTEPAAQPATPTPATTSQQPSGAAPVQVANPSRVSVLSMAVAKNIPLAALISLVIVSISLVGYALTHRLAFQHAMSTGEHFVMTHPSVDMTVFAAVATLILMTTYGQIG